MRISICVCTYNRAHILPHCLESLTNLKVPDGCRAEILVIDNNSNDNTRDVVGRYSRRSPIEILYIYESEQGLSAARNRALKESCGDYVGFLDDECVVRPDWLEIILADIIEYAPFIIGGPYVGALFPETAPKWFKTEYGNAYFLSKHFDRGYHKEFRASGGNMLLHRRVCETVQFDQAFGMKGNELKLGEEALLQERFLTQNAGAMVFYEPRMVVAHYILPRKMSLSYCVRREMEFGASSYRIGSCGLSLLSLRIARAVAYLIVSPFCAAFRDRSVYPYWQNYAYEEIIPRVMPIIGAVRERLRKRYQ